MVQTGKLKLPSLDGLKFDSRLALLTMAGAAALLALAVVFYLWRDNQAMQPLYGAGEAFPAAEVMQVLDAEGVRYRVHPQSGQVLVPESELARARMLLAAKGVKVALPLGYELFDREQPLGTSQFVQNVRLKRSLEGELARTVMSLKGVEQARVHLAIEDSNSFVVSSRGPAKASVLVQLAPGYKLQPEQVGAIVNLVANSVPQLKPEDVSVVDQYGTLLSRSVTASAGAAQNWQAVDEYQKKAAANIEEVLAPIVGKGNYRISVAADIDFSRKEQTIQTFGESPRLRRETQRNESAVDQIALGVPGSLSNRPTPPAPAGARPEQQSAATSSRNETTRQLDYDQSVTHVTFPGFQLRQQSVAVVLNANAAPPGGWTDQARAELEAVIRSAVGLNPERGDLLTISVFPFAPPAVVEEPPLPWWQNREVHNLIKLGLGGLVSVLLLLLVVRPAVRHLTQRDPRPMVGALEGGHGQPALSGGERLPALTAGATEEASGRPSVFSEHNPLSEIHLPGPGSGLEKQIEHLQMLAKNDPERVSEVIKHWIGRNERDLTPVG